MVFDKVSAAAGGGGGGGRGGVSGVTELLRVQTFLGIFFSAHYAAPLYFFVYFDGRALTQSARQPGPTRGGGANDEARMRRSVPRG